MMTELGFLQGTYTPLVHAHAGRTQGISSGQSKVSRFLLSQKDAPLLPATEMSVM